MAKERTFKLKKPLMEGKDVKEWQDWIDKEFGAMNIPCPIVHDGVYGHHTRSYGAALLKARGISRATMYKKGVTPEIRRKIRSRVLTKAEQRTFGSKAIQGLPRASAKGLEAEEGSSSCCHDPC